MSESHSYSSTSELLKDQLESTKSISGKTFDQASILESLTNKVNELQQYKEENIALRSQLKIAQETSKLQEVEFAFQRSELEAEIESMKKEEDELRKGISGQFQGKDHQYDVQVQLKQDQLESKYKKWKNVAHNNREALNTKDEEITKYKSEIENLKIIINEQETKLKNQLEEIGQLKKSQQENAGDIIQKLEKQNKAYRDQNAQINEELQQYVDALKQMHQKYKNIKKQLKENKGLSDESRRLKEELETVKEAKEKLASQLTAANSKIIKQQAKIEQINNDSMSFASSNQELESQLATVEEINEQLKSKSATMKKQLSKLKSSEELLQHTQSTLQQIELERDTLCDILGMNNDDGWNKITKKVEDIVEESIALNDLRTQNEKLQKRLSAALEESKRPASSVIIQSDDEYMKSLQTNLKKSRIELESRKARLDLLEYRQDLAHTLEIQNAYMMKSITDLNLTINGSDTSLARPLFLTVIFARRFLKFKKYEQIYDPRSLQVYAGRESISMQTKISGIRQKFTSLTHDLLQSKQELFETQEQCRKYLDEKDEAQLALSSHSDEIKLDKKKMKYIQKRMLELQSELSALVSPEVYDEVCQRLQLARSQNAEFEKLIDQLNKEIDKRTEIERKMSDEIDHLTIRADQETKVAHEVRLEFAKKQQENEAQRAMIANKTKEILQLEKLIQSFKENEATTAASFSCLAVENQNLQHTLNGNIPNKTEKMINEVSMAPDHVSINPAFLGQ